MSHAKYVEKLRKLTQEIWQMLTRALESLKIGTFIQSRKCMSLKFTGELCVMKLKSDAKFEEEPTCHFKFDKNNLTNVDT